MSEWLEFKDASGVDQRVTIRVRDVVGIRDNKLEHLPQYAAQTMVYLNGHAGVIVAEPYEAVVAKIKAAAAQI